MKKFWFIVIYFLTFQGISQTDNEWVLFNSMEGVNFYKKETDCHPRNIPDQEGVLLRIENTNNYRVEINWHLRIWYDHQEHTDNIKDEENFVKLELQKKETINGSCDTPTGDLYIFKKFITFSGGSEMTNFSLDNMTVKKLK